MLKKKMLVILVSLLLISFFVQPGFAKANSELIIHLVESVQNEDQNSFNVKVHVSVLDENKKPVSDLQIDDFIVKEDSKDVILNGVENSKDLPINMIILLDISGTMSGRIRSAREAISGFINALGDGNQVAIYTFGKQMQQIVGLTSDLDKAQQLFENSNILAVDESACIFNAAYNVAELAETLPQGRRVVVLLTDSHNTTTSESDCSFHTMDDVIDIASQGEINTPFYPIGVGANVDEDGLQRLALRTGGIYYASLDNQGLPGLLNQIYETLSSEYVLSYTSTSAPGTHTISVNYQDLLGTKSFILPVLPPVVSFAYPTEGQYIKPEVQKITLSIMERGLPFENLSFKLNDLAIGVGGGSGEVPYEYPIDFSQYAGQEVVLTCILFDAQGKPVTTKNVLLNVMEKGQEAPVKVSSEENEATSVPQMDDSYSGLGSKNLLLYGGGLVLLIIILIAAVLIIKKKRNKKLVDDPNFEGSDATIDGFSLAGMSSATITILSSDDKNLNGKEYPLVKQDFTIGRSVENDLALPKDSAVSRTHVTLTFKGNGFYLHEELKALPDGTKKPPTYGTYLNDRKISGEVLLHNGDEISLGRRTKLRFESSIDSSSVGSIGSEGLTFDGFEIPDDQTDESTRVG